MLARELMQPKVIAVDSDLSFEELHVRFVQSNVTGFPVVDDGRLVGVVSITDLVRRFVFEHTYAEYASDFFNGEGVGGALHSIEALAKEDSDIAKRLQGSSVKDLMSTEIVTVAPDATVESVANTMVKHHIHRVLVSEDEVLVGIISSFDFVKLYTRS